MTMKRGSAIAAGGPALEQAREAVPGAGAEYTRRCVQRGPSRRPTRRAAAERRVCLYACAVPRREPRRCLRGCAEGLAGKRGASMRTGGEGGPRSGPVGRQAHLLTLTSRAEQKKHVKTLKSRDLGCTQSYMKMRAGIFAKSAGNVEIPRFLQHAR